MLLADLPQLVSEDAKECLSKLVRRDGCDEHGQTILHFAVTDVDSAKLFKTVRLLLQCGADPNTTDDDGNTPLHLLYQLDRNLCDSIGRLLVDNNGACLVRVNVIGKTAKEVCIESNSRRQLNQGAQNYVPSWCCNTVPKLMCLLARVVQSHRFPYSHLPITLHPFIEKH